MKNNIIGNLFSRKILAAYGLSVLLIAGHLQAGSLVGVGSNSSGQSAVPAGEDFVDVAGGTNHSLALKSDGSLVAWGDNNEGQTNVPGGNDFVEIAAGNGANLALKSNGSIVGWGWNGYGQINVPVGNDFVSMSIGFGHSLALKADGSIVGWGLDAFSQASTPAGNDFVAVSAGRYHSLALKSDGSIVAWGYNDKGQAETPVGNDFVAIAAGWDHNLALRQDGSLIGWGYNFSGQATPPVGNDFVDIAAGQGFSVGLKSDGSILAWGSDSFSLQDPQPGNDYVAIAAGQNHYLAVIQTEFFYPTTGELVTEIEDFAATDLQAALEEPFILPGAVDAMETAIGFLVGDSTTVGATGGLANGNPVQAIAKMTQTVRYLRVAQANNLYTLDFQQQVAEYARNSAQIEMIKAIDAGVDISQAEITFLAADELLAAGDYINAVKEYRICVLDVESAYQIPDTSQASFSPDADAHVQSSAPNTNYGSDNNLRVQTNHSTQGDKITYIRFNVNGLSSIQSAILTLWSETCSASVSVYEVNDNTWTESGITYNNAPALGNLLDTVTCADQSWVSWDVSSFVTGDGTYTIAVVSNDVYNDRFFSREHFNDKPPVLDVTGTVGSIISTVNPEADSFVDSAVPHTNYGSNLNLRVQTNNSQGDKITYIRFNVNGSFSSTQSAILRLYSETCSASVSVYEVSDNSWTENGITYNNAPSLGNLLDTTTCANLSWCEWDLSSYITGDGTYSIAVVSNAWNNDRFRSSEHSNQPELVVTGN